MQRYVNAIAGSNGLPVLGALVQVNNFPGGTPASIFSDNGITAAPNPVTTDVNGAFSFYAANGHYQLVISGLNIQTTTLNDVLLTDLTALATSLPASTGVIWDNGGVVSIT
jgi:hypothetical protein